MKNILKLLILLYVIALFALKSTVPYDEVLLLLLIAGVNVFKERVYDSYLLILLSMLMILFGIWLDRDFEVLLAVTVFDLVYSKKYIFLPLAVLFLFIVCLDKTLPVNLLIIGTCGIFGLVVQRSEEKEILYKNSIDDERRLRYELEKTKAQLLNSSKEIAYLAEIKERNRIAREIHDNVGHSIAGVLMQLQAAFKLQGRDQERSNEILRKSIDALSNSLTVMRDTVHNIKSNEAVGIEYLEEIIKEFKFCSVNFKKSGDFSSLSPKHLEFMASNIKEALTNAAKYSKATLIRINIEINTMFLRLLIEDNGIGCTKIKEGLGLSGMRERTMNMGGSFAVSSENGFIIVFIVPIADKEVGIFESVNSGR